MDQLPEEQQENLRKSNTERLRVMAARLGEVEDDEIASMDRPTLIQVVAQTKKDSDKGASGRRESHKSERSKELELQVQLKRMEMEEKRMDQKRVEQEMEHRRLEKETEQKLFEQEREDRRFEMEREDKRFEKEREENQKERELQNEREKRDHELKMAQTNRIPTDQNNGDEQRAEGANVGGGQARPRREMLADRVKRYGSALKQVMSHMTDDASELPQFFENIEAVFQSFEVPDDLWAKLLLPFLSSKAKTLIARLNADEMNNYEGMRDFLLSEFKLTPREYKSRFDNATKKNDETYVYFTARLRNDLRYYLRSRDISDEFDKLCDLLIADKLKSCLPNAPLNYVLSLEGNGWMDPKSVAELAHIRE